MIQNDNYPKRDLLVNEAKKYLGAPYEFNGVGPSTFNSPNFVKYVYKRALNITLPNTTYDQLKLGIKVPMENLLPGDLVFGFKGTHVSIYIGENQIIHSPYKGKKVEISDIIDFYCARRLI